jgi:cytochrome c oxidase subunit 4
MSEPSHPIIPLKTYALILVLLLVLTGTSVAVTQVHLTRWSTLVALLLATAKTSLVLSIFMHLKFDQRIFRVMAVLIFLLLAVVIFITFLDYGFR